MNLRRLTKEDIQKSMNIKKCALLSNQGNVYTIILSNCKMSDIKRTDTNRCWQRAGLEQTSVNLPYKRPNLDFADCPVSVVTTQLCHCDVKTSIDNT